MSRKSSTAQTWTDASIRAKRIEGQKRSWLTRKRIQPPDDWIPPSGKCGCGCGEDTVIAKITNRKRNIYKGFHLRFVHGHHLRNLPPQRASRWNGGRFLSGGYIRIRCEEHPSADSNGYVTEHRLVWEQANGRMLSSNEHIHHINGIRTDNRPENLVALTSSEHHKTHWNDPEYRANMVEKRKKQATPETRRKLSEATTKQWADPKKRPDKNKRQSHP